MESTPFLVGLLPAPVEGTDHWLGIFEFALAMGALGWLVARIARPIPGGLRAPVVLTVLLGTTVAQPFGMTSEEVASAPADAAVVEATGEHQSGPIAFSLYDRKEWLRGENVPTHTLRSRSSLWGPFFYNSTDIADVCPSFPPCWDAPPTEVHRELVRDQDTYWITLRHLPADSEDTFTWRLSFGLASWFGLAYWVLAGGLIALAVFRSRRPAGSPRQRASGSAGWWESP